MIDKKDVEFVFFHEQQLREGIAEKRLEVGGRTGGSGSGHCSISDPTAISAIRNADELACIYVEYGPDTGCGRNRMKVKTPERWLKVIAWTKEYYREPHRTEQGKLLDMHFRQCLSREEACEKLNIGYGKYHAMLNDMLAFAAGMAVGLGI